MEYLLWTFIFSGAWIVRGWGVVRLAVGQKVLIRARILAEAIGMAHSDMLYRLDISTFYFYEPLLFQILISWKFIKTLALPCLLPLLPYISMLLQTTTTTLITISINIFVSNIIQFEISFLIKIYVKVMTNVFYIQIWF